MFLIAIGADYSFDIKSGFSIAPAFFLHKYFDISSVSQQGYSYINLYVSFIRCDDNVEKHLILEIETLQKSQALLRQTSLNAEEEIRQMRKVKFITCFHDS